MSCKINIIEEKELFDAQQIKTRSVLMMVTDGAADEAPRFSKTLNVPVDLFQLLELDALIHGVSAAGLSAFNPLEGVLHLFHIISQV